jgi:hypothetical protein
MSLTPQQLAEAIFAGADRTKCDLRSALDISDEVFNTLSALAERDSIIEEGEYVVKAILTTNIVFSPIVRTHGLSTKDAIENAMDTMGSEVWTAFEYEGWDLTFEAERL